MRLTGAFDVGRRLLANCCCLVLVASGGACGLAAVPRYLVYPPPAGSATTKVQVIFGLGIPMEVDVSTIVGYVMKCNYNLPYNASYPSEPYELRYARSPQYRSGEDFVIPGAIERAELYRMIEAAISSGSQLEGRSCLLRVICEAAATPFDARLSTVFARLLHVLLTPSSTEEPIDQRYLAAERIGGQAGECAHAFPECRANLLDYFSEIH